MDDRTALLRSVIASPDDDLPRLVFADWLDEHDEVGYAAFIRAQIELATTPPWEPYAVHCRHFEKANVIYGSPWDSLLPQLRPGLEWNPHAAFRRGFPWSLMVREMPVFMIDAARLFEEAPLGQLHLPTATLDQWHWLGEQPWLSRVKSIHFYGLTLPIEPVSMLCDSSHATGLEEIVFEVSRGLAMPLLVERLFRSRLGRQLRSLEFRGIDQAQDEFIDAFTSGVEPPRLNRLAFRLCRFQPEQVIQLADSPVLDTLTDLMFDSTSLGFVDRGFEASNFDDRGLRTLVESSRVAGLSRLTLADTFLGRTPFRWLARSTHLHGLRMLSLRQNWMLGQMRPLGWTGMLGRLRSLDVSGTQLDDRSLRSVVSEWATLTELDVSSNKLTTLGMRRLLGAAIPSELTAIDVRGNPFNSKMKEKLCHHFKNRVIL